MTHGNYTNQQNQQTDSQTQYLPYNFQNQAQQYQSQSYTSQQGAPYNEQNNGQANQLIGQKSMSPKSQGLKQSTETLDKSLFSSNSTNADSLQSWLKAGSINSTDLFNNSSSSMAFHSVGNMSASFSSIVGTGGLDTPLTSSVRSEHAVQNSNVSDDVVVGSAGEMGGLRNSGDDSKDNGADSKKSTDERSSSGSARATAVQSGKGNDQEAGSVSTNKGSTYTDSNVPLQPIALQPIQENEADDSSINGDEIFLGHSSLRMSVLEGEFMQSVNGQNSMNLNELSMDSTTFNALMMKQSQTGGDMDISLTDLMDSTAVTPEEATAQKPPLSPEFNPAPSSGGTPVKRGKDDSNSTLSLSQNLRQHSGTSSSVRSSVSMEDNQTKGSNRNRLSSFSKEGSVRSRKSSVSKFSMMSEVSQWTKTNPFEDSGGIDYHPEEDGGASNKKQQQQGGTNVQRDCPVDMGGFHSLGGSLDDSLNLSMMSSMTGDGLSESIRNLDISGRSVDPRKGRGA